LEHPQIRTKGDFVAECKKSYSGGGQPSRFAVMEEVFGMALSAMFEGLIYDEENRPLEVGWVGADACYLYDDAGFLRHLDAAGIDRQVLQFFKNHVLENKDVAIRGMLELMGKDDIFTKTALEYQIAHMDENVDQGMPPQARELLKSLGFKIIIDAQGQLVDIQMPDISDIEGLFGASDF